jgi:hypothetical protein
MCFIWTPAGCRVSWHASCVSLVIPINTLEQNLVLCYNHVNFRCIYFHLKMVRPKHVADNLNKIAKNYWNRVALDGNPLTWSNSRNRMQTPKFKISLHNCYLSFSSFPLMASFYARQHLAVKNKRKKERTKLRGLSPGANYTDRAIAACRRS